jgi:hypothetical protein
MATANSHSEPVIGGNDPTAQDSQTISVPSSASRNGILSDSNAPKTLSDGHHQLGSALETVPGTAEAPTLSPSTSSSNPTSTADYPSNSNPSSKQHIQSSPSQNSSPTTSSAPLPATQTAPQQAPQPIKRRMLHARTPSSNAEPPPRTKRIQVTKKQASYTTFLQVVDRVFVAALKNEYKYDPLDETDNEIRLLVINPAKKLSDPLFCQLVVAINEEIPACPYEALSYMWGDQQATEPIYMFYPELRGVLAKEGMTKKRSFQMKRL